MCDDGGGSWSEPLASQLSATRVTALACSQGQVSGSVHVPCAPHVPGHEEEETVLRVRLSVQPYRRCVREPEGEISLASGVAITVDLHDASAAPIHLRWLTRVYSLPSLVTRCRIVGGRPVLALRPARPRHGRVRLGELSGWLLQVSWSSRRQALPNKSSPTNQVLDPGRASAPVFGRGVSRRRPRGDTAPSALRPCPTSGERISCAHTLLPLAHTHTGVKMRPVRSAALDPDRRPAAHQRLGPLCHRIVIGGWRILSVLIVV